MGLFSGNPVAGCWNAPGKLPSFWGWQAGIMDPRACNCARRCAAETLSSIPVSALWLWWVFPITLVAAVGSLSLLSSPSLSSLRTGWGACVGSVWSSGSQGALVYSEWYNGLLKHASGAPFFLGMTSWCYGSLVCHSARCPLTVMEFSVTVTHYQ